MKLTTYTLLTALAVGGLLAASPVRAQDASTNAPAPTNAAPHIMMRGPAIDRIAKVLNLTDDQKAQVEPIINSQIQQLRTVFRDASLSAADKIAKRDAIRQATDDKLKTILSADQFAKWQSLEASHNRPPRPTANSVAPAAPSAPSAPATPPSP